MKIKLFLLIFVYVGLIYSCATQSNTISTQIGEESIKIIEHSEPISMENNESIINTVNNALLTISEKIVENSTVLLCFYSNDDDLSAYVIDEMIMKLSEINKFQIKHNSYLKIVRPDLNFNFYGKINKNDAETIGNIMDVNVILAGEINNNGADNIFTIKAFIIK